MLQKHYSVGGWARGGYACWTGHTLEGLWVHLGFSSVCLVLEWSHYHPGPQDTPSPGEFVGGGRCVKSGHLCLRRDILCVPRTQEGLEEQKSQKLSESRGGCWACLSHSPSLALPLSFRALPLTPGEPFECPTVCPPDTAIVLRLLQLLAAPPLLVARLWPLPPESLPRRCPGPWASGSCRPCSLQVSPHFKQRLWQV